MLINIMNTFSDLYQTVESPAPVDETETMIQRMFVTLGMTPTSQMKEWYTMTKNVKKCPFVNI